MEGRIPVAVALAIVLAVCAAVAVSYDGPEEHGIVYELDGGELPEDAPDSYIEGRPLVLPEPSRPGYMFGGWFLDPGFTEPVVVIGGSTAGDLAVYACWDPEDLSGTEYVWVVDGSYSNGDVPHVMSGTVTERWMVSSGGDWFVETSYDVLYSWPGGSSLDDRVIGDWRSLDRDGLTFEGIGEAGGYPCTVWVDGDGTRIWLYHLRVEVMSENADGSVSYTMSELSGFEPETEFQPQAVMEYPLSADIPESVGIGDPLELTAVGEGFTGWYLDGEFVTADRTLSIRRADPFMVPEARSGGYVVIDPETQDLAGFGFGEDSEVKDSEGNACVDWTSPGYYTVSASAGQVTRYLEFLVDSHRMFHLEWEYGGRVLTVDLPMNLNTVYLDTYMDTYGHRALLNDRAYMSHFVTPDNPYIKSILSQLRSIDPGADAVDFAELALSFVCAVPYKTDQETAGVIERWSFPSETLWTGAGDCEDKSILYCAIMEAAGYDTALVVFRGHAMAAVDLPVDGESLTSNGTRYVLCETTAPYPIGVSSPGHHLGDVWFWYPVSIRGE